MTERVRFANPEIKKRQLETSELEKILGLQRVILEQAVVSDDFDRLLDELCLLAESFTPDAVATIMMLNHDDGRLYIQNAPSLCQSATATFNGLCQGDGSCGNAVFHNEPMYVCDTFTDARWENLREVATEYNLCSCFSFPIQNKDKESIGSFAISSFVHREPEGFHKALLETCTSICSVILQRRADHEHRKRAFEEQLKSKKLASLGVLAGGIAHDFNNLLGAIIGNIDLAAIDLDEGDARTNLKWAMKAIDRASDLTQQLLAFSRGGCPITSANEIETIIRDSVGFALLGSNVAFELKGMTESLPTVLNVDAGQIGQLFQNLALNSRQAMPDGGHITIRCSLVDHTDHSTLSDGSYLKVEFEDNGPGIPPELCDRVFDPYFTTRDEGHGLGLSLCYSIAKNHNGSLLVDPSRSAGTCFTLYLPKQEGLVVPDGEQVVKPADSVGGRVILMDDEEAVLHTVTRMMQTIGFQVLPAKDGDEVLSLLSQSAVASDEIDAIILDLTVPGGMGGIETKDRILAMRPDAKLIVSSGYSASHVMSDYASHGFSGAVAKPFRIADLQRVMNDVLC